MIRMKQVATKITEYVKKSKRAKLYGVFGLIYLIAVIFVMTLSDTNCKTYKSRDKHSRRE